MKRDASPPNAVEEALARAKLRQMRAKRQRPPAPRIGMAARQATHKVLKGTGSSIAQLKARWSEIAGEKLSAICRPEKITGTKGARTLVLRVLPAAAPLVQHQSETLRQRISVAAGGDIAQIKIVQGNIAQRQAPRKTPRRMLSPQEARWLEDETANIENLKLRSALKRLGTALLTHPGSDTPRDGD